MEALSQQMVGCPYCGESIEILIDQEEVGQRYIEDCQVCCCPIEFDVAVDGDGVPFVAVFQENE